MVIPPLKRTEKYLERMCGSVLGGVWPFVDLAFPWSPHMTEAESKAIRDYVLSAYGLPEGFLENSLVTVPAYDPGYLGAIKL